MNLYVLGEDHMHTRSFKYAKEKQGFEHLDGVRHV